jgi:alkylation response protein AidB-like acyl-CoA dehydrogenase
MDFELSQDQKLLAESAASFAKKTSPVTRARKLRGDAIGYERKVWKQMAELGWLGVPFAEADGGFGGTMVDVMLILEQLGATLVPEPYLASVLLGGLAIARAGSAEQKKQWLEPMIAGDATLALAYAERDSRYDLTCVATRAESAGMGGERVKVTGEKIFVLGGHDADFIVVSARETSGLGLYVVARGDAGVSVRPVKTMDGQHAAIVTLDAVDLGVERRLSAAPAAETLEWVVDQAAAGACAEGLGIMQAVLRMTVDYLRTREQFGVKIGTFQALQHRAVDMFVEVELARGTAMLAAIKAGAADAHERAAAVSAAKVQLGTGGKLVTQQAIQLHGGIGITDEHDVGLYFKRMCALHALFGDEEHHVRRYASLPGFAAEG